MLFLRIVSQMGFAFSDRVMLHVTEALRIRLSPSLLSKRQAFDVSDLRELGDRIKPLNIIPESRGHLFANQAKVSSTDSTEMKRLSVSPSIFRCPSHS